MKKTLIIKGCVFTLLFFLFLFLFNGYYSGKNEGTSEMNGATLPVMEIYLGDTAVNQMHGYLGEIDAALLRDAITPIDGTTEMKIAVTDYDYDITAVSYQIYSGSNEELLAEGVLNKLETIDGKKEQTLDIGAGLKEGEEYLIKYMIRLDSSRKVSYYSRVKCGSGFHYKESIAFAKELSDMMLKKDETLNRYLEPNSEKINNNLASVTIHSSFAAVTYAQAVPERIGDVKVSMKEVNEDYTVVELRWILAMKNGKGQLQYADVVENYKIRYGATRMYLLDYSRTQDAFYNPEVIDAANNRITLGTGITTEVDYLYDEENEKVCFVKNRQLWYYSYQSTAVTKVFSFWNDDKTENRSGCNQHNIHILDMDEEGNIDFIVYGYMNRGRHEGQNGITIYRFLTENSCLCELAFIPLSIPYQNMKEDMNKFAYLNEDDIFFFLLDGTLYRVDTATGEWEILRNNLISNSLTASSDNHIIAVQEQEDVTKNTKIDLINLETGEEQSLTCESGQRLQAIGFVLSDFVYGIAKEEDVKVSNNGTVVFPMDKIHIMNEQGEEVKTYSKSGQYVIRALVEGNGIEMTYAKKNGNSYVETKTDTVKFKEESAGSSIAVEYGYDGTCYNQVYLSFPPYIYVQTVPALKVAKEVITDDMKVVMLEEEKSEAAQYLVYANGTLVETYLTVSEAITKAEEIRGLVVNNNRQTVWESNIPSYNQVVGLNIIKAEKKKDTFAACVSMLAALEGQDVDPEQVQEYQGERWEIIARCTGKTGLNLYGMNLEQILYYIGKETPVIADIGNEYYVVVMSYNSTKVRYKDPYLGEDVLVTREEFENLTQRGGNEYYSYIR